MRNEKGLCYDDSVLDNSYYSCSKVTIKWISDDKIRYIFKYSAASKNVIFEYNRVDCNEIPTELRKEPEY